MRDNVVLPAPEGEDSTSRSPLRAIASLCRPRGCPAIPLLQVLDLLAELLDQALELEPDIGQLHVARLGAQRVGLAVELLGEKIELAADRAAVPGRRAGFA